MIAQISTHSHQEIDEMFPSRNIWFMWTQGLDAAPPLVRRCYESWKCFNPGWTVQIVDKWNMNSLIDLELPKHTLDGMSANHLSDVVRLKLLRKYGGVWVDATVLCAAPLYKWLFPLVEHGFFAYHKPGPDRVMSTWFLASTAGHPIVEKLDISFTEYWRTHDFIRSITYQKVMHRLLYPLLSRNVTTTSLWFSFVVTKLLRVYPYFALHYLFAHLVLQDKEFNAAWTCTPKRSPEPLLKFLIHGLNQPITPELKYAIASQEDPMYKLNWRIEPNGSPDTTLRYLLK